MKLTIIGAGNVGRTLGAAAQRSGHTDAGPLVKARLTEPFAALWISLAFQAGFGPDFAFSVIRR